MECQRSLFGCASKVQKQKNKELDSPRKAYEQQNARVFVPSNHGIELLLDKYLSHVYSRAANRNKLRPFDYCTAA